MWVLCQPLFESNINEPENDNLQTLVGQITPSNPAEQLSFALLASTCQVRPIFIGLTIPPDLLQFASAASPRAFY